MDKHKYLARNGQWVHQSHPSMPINPAWGGSNWPPRLGVDKPGPHNTGPRPGVELERYDGDYIVNSPDQVVSGLDIHGRLIIKKNMFNTHVHDCIIRGPGGQDKWPSGETELIVSSGSQNLSDALIEDCKLDATGRENPWVAGMNNGRVTMRRCEITRTIDGLSMTSIDGNYTIEGCWIHGGMFEAWLPGTPNKPGWSDRRVHADGIQIHQGKMFRITGNYVGGYRQVPNPPVSTSPWETVNLESMALQAVSDDWFNACMMIKQEVDATAVRKIEDCIIDRNWFAGGDATINMAYANSNDLSGVTLTNNRFARVNPVITNHPYIIQGGPTYPVMSGNIMEDTLLPTEIKDW